jgi:TolB-like protein/Tfp pilus assembly protein PilF
MSQSTISRIYDDLSRRKVFRATALYGVVAWFAIQVAEATFEPLNLPQSAYRLVVILALAGFPVVIVLAWAYDFTRRGFVRTAPAAAPIPIGWRQRIVDFVIIGVLAALVVYLWMRPGAPTSGAGGGALRSIAVLPFEDFSENRDQAYFGDGVAEELLNALVGVDGLRVAARTSSFAFRGSQEDVRKIGQELAVDTVLEGSVRRSGDRVKITAQLIDTKDGYHLWSKVYDSEITDIFAVQENISRSIADELKLRLGDAATQRLANAPTNVGAYDKYLEGRKKWNERTRTSLEEARVLFTEAVKLDPNYAPAFSGLADTYLLLSEAQYGTLKAEEVLQHAEPAIARALELNGGLAEAYASLGLLRWSIGEMTFAQLALRKAIELNPSYSMAHFWLGSVLLETGGSLLDATAEYREAYSRDPYQATIAFNYASALGQLGEEEEARQIAMRVAERYPDSPKPCAALADLAEKAGRLDEAVYWVRRAEALPGDDGSSSALLAKLYAELGDMNRAREALARAQAGGPSENHTLQVQAFMAVLDKDWELVSRLADPYVPDASEELSHGYLRERARTALFLGGVASLAQGDAPTALARLQRLDLDAAASGGFGGPGDRITARNAWAMALQGTGRPDDARRVLEQTLQIASDARTAGWRIGAIGFPLAETYVLLGEHDRALATIDEAMRAGVVQKWYLDVLPAFGALRGDPAFEDAIAKLDAKLAAQRARAGDPPADAPKPSTTG